MTDETIPEAPRRGRPPRVQVNTENRRRRRGTLDVMTQSAQGYVVPYLNMDEYQYRWVNDEGGRLRDLTVFDDYDYVTADELGEGFDVDTMSDSESNGRIRIIAGHTNSGKPLYQYLCKKPRAFWEADNAEMVAMRESLMEGRVYAAQSDVPVAAPGDGRPGGEDKFYAPKGNQIGHAAMRRRGPVATRSL